LPGIGRGSAAQNPNNNVAGSNGVSMVFRIFSIRITFTKLSALCNFHHRYHDIYGDLFTDYDFNGSNHLQKEGGIRTYVATGAM
jgi:hypothetical protein